MDITRTLKSVLVLDLEGNKVLSRNFDETCNSKKYEKKLFMSTRSPRTKDEVLVIDETIVMHRFITDLHFYVIGSRNENPIILDLVLDCFVDVVTSLTSKAVERQGMLKHLTKILLSLDEICDNGTILETDCESVLQRVCLKEDVAEQSMTQRLQNATEQFKLSWIRSYS